jgi:hypothetical protein
MPGFSQPGTNPTIVFSLTLKMFNKANYNTGVAIANSEVVELAPFKQVLLIYNFTLVHKTQNQYCKILNLQLY